MLMTSTGVKDKAAASSLEPALLANLANSAPLLEEDALTLVNLAVPAAVMLDLIVVSSLILTSTTIVITLLLQAPLDYLQLNPTAEASTADASKVLWVALPAPASASSTPAVALVAAPN